MPPSAMASRVRVTMASVGRVAAPPPGAQEELERHRVAGTWERRRTRRAPRRTTRRSGRPRRRAGLARGPASRRATAIWAARWPANAPAWRSTSSRRVPHASATASRTLPNAGMPWRSVGREVGAAEERSQVRREEDAHRPAAGAGHGLDGGHVDVVEVRPLLAVHLDADEVLVHERGDLGVLEALALHDVAPVARRVADREEDRPVLALRPLERLGAPRVPVDRVVGVLEQVRARLVRQPVRHGAKCRTHRPACRTARRSLSIAVARPRLHRVEGPSRPETQFAWHGDDALAYQVIGDGPSTWCTSRAVVSNVELNWDHPAMARFLTALAAGRRLIVADARGWGCSERSSPSEPWPIELLMEDLRVVLDAVGSRRAVIMASNDCAFAATLFGATYPERTAGLILYEASANWLWTEETPWEWTAERWKDEIASYLTWSRADAADDVATFAPSMAGDERYVEWWYRYFLLSGSLGLRGRLRGQVHGDGHSRHPSRDPGARRRPRSTRPSRAELARVLDLRGRPHSRAHGWSSCRAVTGRCGSGTWTR